LSRHGSDRPECGNEELTSAPVIGDPLGYLGNSTLTTTSEQQPGIFCGTKLTSPVCAVLSH